MVNEVTSHIENRVSPSSLAGRLKRPAGNSLSRPNHRRVAPRTVFASTYIDIETTLGSREDLVTP